MGWYDRRTRRTRDLSCGDARIYLEFEVRRVQCKSCGKVKRERLEFLADNPFYTKRFAHYVGRRCRSSSIKDIAQELNLDWDTVSQLAKQHVTVSLSGDAGDELFGGYNRYRITDNFWKKLSLMPVSLRALMAKGITGLSPAAWDGLAGIIPGASRYASLGDKMHKGAAVLTSRTADELYLRMVSHLRNPSDWVIDGQEPPTYLTGLHPDFGGLGTVERMMALDTISYLPDDILVKVDRAGMGVSLENRVPFLDHRIVEFAWSLPLDFKLRDGQSKWPLRQLLYRHVPRELIDRPKMGFGVTPFLH